MTGVSDIRRESKTVMVGNVAIGGKAPVAVQSMTNTKTRDYSATLEQIFKLADAGCEIVRVAIPAREDITGLEKIVSRSPIPVVADIHFDHRLALAAIDAGAAKIRINPGNIGSNERVAAIVDKAKEANIPIRIGLNSGSLPIETAGQGLTIAGRLVASARDYISFFEEYNFDDIVISVKASEVTETIEAYRDISRISEYPLHLGVTEAGNLLRAAVKSSVAMGILLNEGIGDTLRVSVTGDPIDEVKIAYQILSSLDIRRSGPEVISCPTCGRCEIDLAGIALDVENVLSKIKTPIKVAVMGCAVNGPGEAKSADIGIAGGREKGLIFVRGEIVRRVPEAELLAAFKEELARLLG